jgi:hypothetical protein
MSDYNGNQNLENCDPQLYYNSSGDSKNNGMESKIIKPCGLIAWSLFNDTYSVRGCGRGATAARQQQ